MVVRSGIAPANAISGNSRSTEMEMTRRIGKLFSVRFCPCKEAAGVCACRLPVVHRKLTVDVNRYDAFRHLLRVFEGAAIDDGVWIEKNEIGFRAYTQHAAINEAEFFRREAGHTMNRFGKRKKAFI